MALTVEDGTSVASADSYISADDALAYVTNFHGASHAFVATATADERDAYLRLAAQALDGKYRSRFRGLKADADQGLQWPRSSAHDDTGTTYEDTVPQCLKDAVCEVARRLAEGTDYLVDATGMGGDMKELKAGPVGIKYEAGSSSGISFPQVEGLVGELLDATTGLFRS